MIHFFGSQYNFYSFLLFLILGVLGLIFTLKINYRKLTFYYEGLSFFNLDFTSRISKLNLFTKEIEIDPLKDYLTFTCFVQNTGNTDLIKSDFTDNIKIKLIDEVKILDFAVTDYPQNVKSSILESSDAEIEIEFKLLKKGEIIKIVLLIEVEKIKKLIPLERKILKDLNFSYRGINFKKHEFILALKRNTANLYSQLIAFVSFYAIFILYMLYSTHFIKTRSSYDVIEMAGKTYYGDVLLLHSDTIKLYDLVKDSVLELKINFSDTAQMNSFKIANKQRVSILRVPDGIIFWIFFVVAFFMPFLQFADQLKYKKRIERIIK